MTEPGFDIDPNPKGGGTNLIFWQIFLENSMKTKKNESQGEGDRASMAPPLDTALLGTVLNHCFSKIADD